MNINEALKQCETEIKNNRYEEAEPQCIYNLPKYVLTDEDSNHAKHFLTQSIGWLRDPQHGIYKSELPNDILYTACIEALSVLSDASMSTFFVDEFKKNTGEEISYEMMVANGRIALAVARWESKEAVPTLDKFLAEWSQYEGDDFWMEVQYSAWIIEKNYLAAKEYLLTKKQGLSFASAALCDLDAKDCTDDIKTVLPKIKHPVTRLVLQESIKRLESQAKIPAQDKRIIWLFGLYPESLKGMGHYNEDNFFIKLSGELYQTDEADRGNLGTDY